MEPTITVPAVSVPAVSPVVLSYRARAVTHSDLAFIRSLIAQHPSASRRALSKLLCEAWSWRQENGVLRDMVCRSLMLALHRAGHIELPPLRARPKNNLALRRRPQPTLLEHAIDQSPFSGSLGALGSIEFRQVRRTAEEPLFNRLIEKWHYLGYTQPVGEHLKYLVYAQGRPIACLAWCSAPRHLRPRDRFIGWSREARARNLRFLAYNTRYLILPWLQVPHLASHLLGRMAKTISRDWQERYGHPVHFLETFTDPARFRGTCYRAANWIALGRTTGRGHNAPTRKPRVPVKEILAYPLRRDFRDLLGK